MSVGLQKIDILNLKEKHIPEPLDRPAWSPRYSYTYNLTFLDSISLIWNWFSMKKKLKLSTTINRKRSCTNINFYSQKKHQWKVKNNQNYKSNLYQLKEKSKAPKTTRVWKTPMKRLYEKN